MRKLLFAAIVDATINRFSSYFANVFLRRLTTHVAASDANTIAEIEERIAQLEEEGRPLAAQRLAAHLDAYAGDDPSYEVTTCFGRQLLADSFETNTPEQRGEPLDDDPPKKRGRSKAKSNNRLANRT